MSDRFLHAIFCDDIRFELQNKLSLMGIYYGSITPEALPTYLARFCAHAVAVTPVERPFRQVDLQLLLNDVVVQEMSVPPEALVMDPEKSLLPTPSRLAAFGGNLVVSPLYLSEPGVISVRAITEEGILTGPRLPVLTPPTY